MEIHNKPSVTTTMFNNDILPKVTPQQMKLWKTEIAEQENILKRICHNALDVSNQMDVDIAVPSTENGDNILFTDQSHMQKNVILCSEVSFGLSLPQAIQSREQLLQDIIIKETLNAKQVISFQIIAQEFFKYLDNKEKNVNNPNDAKFKPYM